MSAEAGSLTFNYTMVNHPNAGPNGTWPWGITDGLVVYGEYADASNFGHFFTYSNGTYSDFPLNDILPFGVNNAGVIVGVGYCGTTVFSGCIRQTNGAFTTYPGLGINDINDLGTAVGGTGTNGTGHAIVFSNGVPQELGIPGDSVATGINNLNQIVGWYRTGGFGSFVHGFIWQNGTYITLDAPYGSGSQGITGINDSGMIAADDYVYMGGQWIYLGYGSGFQVQIVGINNLGVMVGHTGPGFQGIIVAPAGYSKTTYDPETGQIVGIINSIYPIPEPSSGLRSMSAMPAAFALSSQESSSTVPERSTLSVVGIGILAIAATARLRILRKSFWLQAAPR
jgi:probable HAF family extracellular repeat protein